jgi:superfamily II DNA or RNA helicase
MISPTQKSEDPQKKGTFVVTLAKSGLIQYTGRLHRLHPGKHEVRIYDYVDRGVPMLERMFERRLRGYPAIGYAPGETVAVPCSAAQEKDDSRDSAGRRRCQADQGG